MNSSAPFTVYNASAGSGKTFALVKAYLSKILVHPNNGYYKHLLGITFTNKAVAEMKERIVATLYALSLQKVPKDYLGMQELLISETALSGEKIRERSHNILKHLLHHYAQFNIETIDSFNHRLIRTFAHDLKLTTNFEVSLETDSLLAEAVDQFIEKAGTDPEVTQLLLEYALQKTDEDKSWDISFDLKKTASLLASENDRWHLQLLREKSITDFRKLQKQLRQDAETLKQEIQAEATQVLDTLIEREIPFDVFQRGTFPNHFKKLQQGAYDVYKNNLETYLEVGGAKLYKSQTPDSMKQEIDGLTPDFLKSYRICKKKVYRLKLHQSILKNLVPLAALNGVYQEVEEIKLEENILPIHEFNSLIFKEIKDQPAPFIYERLGDRYRHFFVDEFQDTSKLQWDNLVPLIDNALSQIQADGEAGSLLLVGDAKQSIYRWRGGLPEQFMALAAESNPFPGIQKQSISLETNYRSAPQIIEFNNQLFTYIAPHFGHHFHTQMYAEGSRQKPTEKEGGYVRVEFLETQNREEEHQRYPEKVHETLKGLLQRGYAPKDICILTRRKKDGVAISEYLLETDPTLPLVSEETLLLKNSELVNHLIHLLELVLDPNHEEAKLKVLEFFYDLLGLKSDRHDFYSDYLERPNDDLTNVLAESGLDFHFEKAYQLPLFECLEYCVASLRLAHRFNAFANSFMDLVFRFSKRPGAGKMEFLEYWETEREKACITATTEANAVHLMTIHKSKGLEFPVVIFPYANVGIYDEIDPKSWFPWQEEGFENVLIDYKKEWENVSAYGAEMVKQRMETLELDNINLLYVALTRPKQELYVFAKKESIRESLNSYNQYVMAFLKSQGAWQEELSVYEFGAPGPVQVAESQTPYLPVTIGYRSSLPESHNLSIVTASVFDSEDQVAAIGLGNLFHDTMAKIFTLADVEGVLNDMETSASLDNTTLAGLRKTVQDVTNHPELKGYYENPFKVLNEREIATPQKMLRPDRIVIHEDGSATVIDYKTGAPNPKYTEQIYAYSDALEAMGHSVRERLLVYGNPNKIVINKA